MQTTGAERLQKFVSFHSSSNKSLAKPVLNERKVQDMALNPKLQEFLRKQAESRLTKAVTEALSPGKKESFAMSVVLDEDQQHAVELAESGKSFCLIGKAGTGKTELGTMAE